MADSEIGDTSITPNQMASWLSQRLMVVSQRQMVAPLISATKPLAESFRSKVEDVGLRWLVVA